MTIRDYITTVLDNIGDTFEGGVIDFELHLDSDGKVIHNGQNIVRLSVRMGNKETKDSPRKLLPPPTKLAERL